MIEFIAFVINPIILILLSFISFPLSEYLKGDCSIKESIKKVYSNLFIRLNDFSMLYTMFNFNY